MRVLPRFVGRLGAADWVTAANAALGFVAVAVATVDPTLAARLVLLAAIADGLDGVIARHHGSTPVGAYLDSLADVASFAVAPAALVFVLAAREWGVVSGGIEPGWRLLLSLSVTAAFVVMAVVRLGLYNAYDLGSASTEGVQTTLAATLLAAVHLADVAGMVGVPEATLLLSATGVFVYLMVAPVTYPELLARDALVLGGLQALAILLPRVVGRVFPRALLLFALGYLVLSPRFYWRDT
jgi:CDP-diacylglycerol--serine O-phosphatidyltransferase